MIKQKESKREREGEKEKKRELGNGSSNNLGYKKVLTIIDSLAFQCHLFPVKSCF